MKKNIILTVIILLHTICLKSQTITFTIPDMANKNYSFAIYNGLKMDTIVQGISKAGGIGEIVIPHEYNSIPAMGAFTIEGENAIALIINNENFSFQLQNGKPTFKDSYENDLLYNKTNEALLEKNKNTYAYAHFKTLNTLSSVVKVINNGRGSSLVEKTNARIKILNDVDMDKLYYSQFWFYIIDGLMRLSIGQEGFANGATRLLDKTNSDKVYLALVENLITITNQFGMDDAFDIIIPHVINSDRIKYPQGTVYDAFAMAKIRKGVEAPDLQGLKNPLGTTEHKYTLIVFHQPDCDNCREQLSTLKNNYTFFKDKNTRVITISGALEKELYEKENSDFPWSDKLCDLKGFAGNNFQNYGVIGTPTIYLIDKDKVVLGRFALISDIERYMRAL